MPKPPQTQFDLFTKPLPQEPSRSSLDFKPGTKRLFSNTYNSSTNGNDGDVDRRRSTSQSYGDENENACDDDDLGSNSGKRHRTSDWPLKNSDKQDLSSKAPLGSRSRGNGGSVSCSKMRPPPTRPSKFLEGSMNDRVSQKPNPAYIGSDEEIRQRYDMEQLELTAGRKKQMAGLAHHSNCSVGLGSLADKSDTSRQSGMFRFGKSLSAAFNPSNWKIWSKKSLDDDDNEDLQAQILRERRENAEKIYKDMKQKGQFQDSTGVAGLNFRHSDLVTVKHDSGVEFDQRMSVDNVLARRRTSSEVPNEEKRYGRVYLEPPKMPAAARSESPASEALSSPRKSSFHFKKPSLSNLKFKPGGSQKSEPAEDSTYDAERMKRLPSHKDLQKQQKLVKRVSDLEGRLEAARRHLSEALGEPVPDIPSYSSRPRFKPGNLASLPSERLLSSYLSTNEATEDPNADIGMAISSDSCLKIDEGPKVKHKESATRGVQEETDMPSSPTVPEKHVPEILPSVECDPPETDRIEIPPSGLAAKANDRNAAISAALAKETPKKRKSIGLGMADDGGKYKPTSEDSYVDDEFEAPKKLSPKQKVLRARKLRKVDSSSNLAGSLAAEKTKSKDWTYGDAINKLQHTRGRTVLSKKALSRTDGGSKIPRKGRQSTSPPPDSSRTDAKALSMGTTFDKKALYDEGEDEGSNFSFAPTRDAPPVPKVPRSVRLASGEVVKIPGAAVPSVTKKPGVDDPDSKKGSTKSVDGTEGTQLFKGEEKKDNGQFKRKEAFEWPADVF